MPSASPLRQTTLAFPQKGHLAISDSPPLHSSSPAASPQSSSRSKHPKPIRHAFVDKAKQVRASQDGYRSAAESVGSDESEGEPQLRRYKDHVEVGAEDDYLFDDEAEDDDDYESGDSRDGAGSDERQVSDDGRRRRTRPKRRRSSSVEVNALPPSSSKKRRAVVVESSPPDDESDVVVQDDPPVASTSVRPVVLPANVLSLTLTDSGSASEQHHRLASQTASTNPAASTSQHLAVPSAPASTSVSRFQSQSSALPSRARPFQRAGSRSTFEGVIIYTPSPSVSPRARSKAPASRPSRAGTLAPEEANPDVDMDEEDDDASIVGPSSSTRKGKGKKRGVVESSSDSDHSPVDSDDDHLPVPVSLMSKPKPSAKPKAKRQPKTRQKLTHLSQGIRDRRSADEASGDELDWVVEDGEDEGEKKRRRKRKGKEKARKKSEEDDDEAAQASDESDEVVVPKKRKGKGKGKEKAKEKERSKKRRRRRSPSVDEEPDDLEILDEVTVREDKLRARKSTAGRFADLKAARERKAASSSQAKPPRIVLDSSDEDEASSRAASASPYPASLSQLRRAHQQPTRTHRPSPRFLGDPSHPSSSSTESSSSSDSDSATPDLDDNLEHFIVDEDADDEGRAIVQEFVDSVRGKSQGVKYYLKTYLLYLVHLIVCPQVNWLDDPEFKEAQERVHGQLQGMLQSLIGSSAWKPKFQHVMDSRPEMTLVELGADEKGAACDACTMGNSRHSAFVASVGGPKYDRKTLRPIASSDDSSEESSSDTDTDSDDDDDSDVAPKKKRKSKKRKGKGKKKSRDKVYEFNLGKFCAGRSEVYHTFTHWAFTTRERMAQKLAPLQREVAPAQLHEGMSKEERKEAKKREVDRRADEATRLGGVLEERKVISDFANRLEKEIQDAIASFSERR
ncbi:hypothetical protein JCM1840_002722 [Sporobolomyces johnsonii]